MCPYYKKIAILVLGVMSFYSCSSSDDTWDIIAVGLPKVISPKIANINMGLYILKQTHEPLLRYKKRTILFSNLLKSWTRDTENKKFNFCLKKGLNFSKGKPFNQKMFEAYLDDHANFFEGGHSTNQQKGCVAIHFNKSQKHFLDSLTKYKHAPSLKSNNHSWEVGLGKFSISTIEKNKISLRRKVKDNDGYNSINFWSYSGNNDPILKKDNIEDYNRVLVQDLPLKKVEGYQRFNVALLQTVNLVLNVKDNDLRKKIFHCLDIQELRQAFMPKQINFLNIGSILPSGIPHSKEGLAKQECSANSKSITRELKFYNWNKSSSKSLRKYFAQIKNRTGISIQVVDITMNQFVEMVLKSPHPYDLTIVALDAIDVDYNAYFSPVIDETSIIDIERPSLRRLYNYYKKSKDDTKIGLISSKILERSLLLPLYQEVRDFYFPKHVKGLVLGKNDLEYLEISELSR